MLALCAGCDGAATQALRTQTHKPRAMVSNTLLTTRRALFPATRQDRDLGYASAAVAAQLEATRLLARVDRVVAGMHGVRDALLPRRDSAAGGSLDAPLTFASLPHAVALTIFGFVRADQRARIALVCRAWRDALADPAAWTCLNLSTVEWGGVTVAVTDATLRAAAARGNGRLCELYLDDRDNLTTAVRLDVVTANAGTLRSLSCLACTVDQNRPFQEVEALVRAAPHLEEFRVDAMATVEQALRMLRNESPFETLELRSLCVSAVEERVDEAGVLELATALQGRLSLDTLDLRGLPLQIPAALDAVCAAQAALKVPNLMLTDCHLGPAAVPALVRLIRGDKCTGLTIKNGGVQLLDEAAGMQLASAFATNGMQHVILDNVDLWNDLNAAVAVLQALTRHPTLHWLELIRNVPANAAAAGVALGALLAANSSTVTTVNIGGSFLGDAGFAPIMVALSRNTHLSQFCCCNMDMSVEFARERFLPAVRANTSLRNLLASERWGVHDGEAPPAEVLEAEALVAARRR